MNKKSLLALVASLGMVVATGAHAATSSGTVTSLKTALHITSFQLSSTGSALYYIIDADWDVFYDEGSYNAMIARINGAYNTGENITITYVSGNCGAGWTTCPSIIQ